ncbi:Serine/threonine-protein kinase Sgk2, partial [Coemansia nantahalensis]
WWVIRRYSEFQDLCAALKRHYPKHAGRWAELFPTRRFGQSPSIEVAAQWTDRLNVFLRAVTADTDVCPAEDIQRFLRENAPPPGALSPPPDADIYAPAAVLAAPPALRDPMGRVSMPALKGAAYGMQVATPPTSGSVLPTIMDGQVAAAAPRQTPSSASSSTASSAAQLAALDTTPRMPPRPGKHQSVGSEGAQRAYFAAGAGIGRPGSPVLRKASDSLLYLSVEKRPNIEPLTMRKKYGLRGNVQHVTGSQQRRAEQGPEPAATPVPEEDADALSPPPPPAPLPVGLGILAGRGGLLAAASQRPPPPVPSSPPRPPPPALTKALSWGALGSTPPAPPRDADCDVAMRSPETGPDTARPQARHAQQLRVQRKQPAQGNFNSLMSALATEPLGSAPLAAQPVEAVAEQQQRVSLDDFHLLSIIGKGSYGKVMLARHKDTGKVMAIKVISKSKLRGRPNEIRRVMSERKVLERTVEHPFLVGLQCAFQTKEQLFFCLDYVNGGELFFHLQRERRFSENRARFYAAEITCALEYLHGMGVVYRDLKPENCLLDAQGHVRIVDFGLAKEVGPVVWRTEGSTLYSVEESGKTGTFCGTPEYLAPEVLLRQRYGKEVDWYCLGAVLYEMLTGLPPFYDQDNNTMYRRILHESLQFPTTLPPPLRGNGTYNDDSSGKMPNTTGRLAQDFITRILERDPEKRLGHGMFGTENVKRHVYFHGIDWGKIYRQEYAPPFVPKVSSIFDLSNIDPEFRNEPIPESILSEGQVDIMAEVAEAERQAELDLHAHLMAFPSPLSVSSVSPPLASPSIQKQQQQRLGVASPMSLNNSLRLAHASGDGGGDAFQGFSFVSPWVDMPDRPM